MRQTTISFQVIVLLIFLKQILKSRSNGNLFLQKEI